MNKVVIILAGLLTSLSVATTYSHFGQEGREENGMEMQNGMRNDDMQDGMRNKSGEESRDADLSGTDLSGTDLSGKLAQGGETIADKAMGDRQFDTLVVAVKAAGLPPVLKGKDELTVFAPTNEAFDKAVKKGLDLNALLKDIPKLTKVLKYHVVAGKVDAKKLGGLKTLKTLEGEELKITKRADGTIYVDNAKVIIPNIEASNGVIHAIDRVLMP